ncbi:MAG: hypothetical protein Q9217_001038 [Psora testacea]
MAGDEPEVGDKASWNWNGAQPEGEVAEKKTEGEVSIQSKRGNTIRKPAQQDDPAIHLSRPGNDVVKNASELQVEEKKSDASGEKDAGEEKGETHGGAKKRKADDEGEGKREVKKARGRPKGTTGRGEKKTSTANGEKKPRGRPKKESGAASGGPKKEKKSKQDGKPMAPPTGIGKRTRSQK